MLISLNTAFPLDKGNADAENEMMVRFLKGSGESVIRRNSSNDSFMLQAFATLKTGNWTEITFAKASGTVTRDREKLANR